MTGFQRRRPRWPFLAGLVLLFLLTIAATWSWRRLGLHESSVRAPEIATPCEAGPCREQSTRSAEYAESRELASVAAVPAVAPPPVLPPLVEDLRLGDPAAMSVSSPVLPVQAVSPLVLSDENDLRGEVGPPPAAPISKPLRRLQVEDLVKLRSAVWGLLKEARHYELPAEHLDPGRGVPPVVRVESSHDRLAMVESRGRVSVESRVGPSIAPDPQITAAQIEALTARIEPLRAALARDLPRYFDGRLARRLTAPPEVLPEPSLIDIPAAVIDAVRAAGEVSVATSWSDQVEQRLMNLACPSNSTDAAQQVLDELSTLASQGFNDALELPEPTLQRTWLRACHSIRRHLPLWRALADPTLVAAASSAGGFPAEPLRLSLHEIGALTAQSEEGRGWQSYLRLDDLSALTSVGGSEQIQNQRRVARDVLARMQATNLSVAQRQFLGSAPFVALADNLRRGATGPLDLRRLASLLQRYEREGSEADADAIAEACWRLSLSPVPALAQLGVDLDRQYRNANLRFALTAELLNRLIPSQGEVVAPVKDRVAGAEVRGRSRINTQVQIALLPEVGQWRMALEAAGTVRSRTHSESWPARLRNAGNMHYEARKQILLGGNGLQTLPAEASAHGSNRLLAVETEFDPLPLVGDLFREVARRRHRDRQPAAMAEVERKVANQARQRLDRETEEKLRALEDHFQTVVFGPLQQLALVTDPIDMHTTERRAVMRLRMADPQQLASHTPRPSAPSDSLLSFQVHESALNNAAEGLDLNGKRMTVEELHQTLTMRLRGEAAELPTDLPRRAAIAFAPTDAVRLHCDNDRVQLTLSIAQLVLGRDSIEKIKVYANFRPESDGLNVQLVREGTLQFDGPHLRTGTRMVLHGVFNKLIRKDEPLVLLPASLESDARLDGLMVTQLVVEDGWVAVALGPAVEARTAWRAGDEPQHR